MRTSRKIAAFLTLALALGAGVAAQNKPDAPGNAGEFRKELKSLALEDKEVDSLEKIVQRDADALEKAQAEIRILQARLERLMLEKKPPMEDIKTLVKQSLDWEFQIRMIRIQRNLDIRALIGDDRWAKAYRLAKEYVQVRKNGKAGEKDADPKIQRQLNFLEALQ
jgi:hypothetical protein